MEPQICVVGSSNMDLISYVPRMPQKGETIRGSKFESGYGGKGANQAVAAALLGAKVNMVCKVGTDFYGKAMVQNFKELGMDEASIIITPDTATGVASIFVAEDGANEIVIVSGANDEMTPEEVLEKKSAFQGAKILLTQLEVKLDTTIAALKHAKENGIITILNTAPAQELPEDIYKYCDIVSPNETELALLTGRSVDTIEDATAAARVLISRGAKQVLVTLGERGSLFVSSDSVTHEPSEKVKAIDTTGAGDCFLGSFAFFYARGEEVKSCMKKANHLAGVSVTRKGTQTSFPRRKELPDSLFQ